MKKLMLIVMLMFCGTITQAQDNFEKKTVQVLPTSSLTITGDTNINKFTCNFDTSYLKEPQLIHFSENNSEINFTGAVLTLVTKGFDCGSKAINKDFHALIKSDQHPEIFLEMNKVKLISPTKGVARVCITIAGKQKFYDLPVNIKKGKISEFKGKLELDIKDFDLEPPKKLFGIIVVKDDIQINFDLRVKI